MSRTHTHRHNRQAAATALATGAIAAVALVGVESAHAAEPQVVSLGACAFGTGNAGIIFTTQGLFFSGTAVVTFGGAYAVLAYGAQNTVGASTPCSPPAPATTGDRSTSTCPTSTPGGRWRC